MPVEFVGVSELRKALKTYAPDLEKALKLELKEATSSVVHAARGYAPAAAPLSNWGKGSGKFPIYNSRIVKNGIRLATGRTKTNNAGFSYPIRIVNASAAGAIYETAGRANPWGQPWVGPAGSANHRYSHSQNKYAGRDFIAHMGGTMKGKAKERGRLLYRAWEEDSGKTQDAVIKAVMKANNSFAAKTGKVITRGFRKAA